MNFKADIVDKYMARVTELDKDEMIKAIEETKQFLIRYIDDAIRGINNEGTSRTISAVIMSSLFIGAAGMLIKTADSIDEFTGGLMEAFLESEVKKDDSHEC